MPHVLKCCTDIDAVWSTVLPWIEDACDECDGWWTSSVVRSLLTENRAILWVLEDGETPVAAVVTAVANWDDRRVAEIIATGGTGVIGALRDELPKIEHWARSSGAQEIMFRGRRGWSRIYKPHGYEEIAVTLRKAL